MPHNHHHGTIQVGSKLRAGIFFSVLILAAEIAGGILTNSVALLADAGHVLTDVIALALSWYGVAQAQASRYAAHDLRLPPHRGAYCGAQRLHHHRRGRFYPLRGDKAHGQAARGAQHSHDDRGRRGLAVNLFVAFWLREERGENLNVRSAFWHAAGDALASVGVIVGGIIITTHRTQYS